MGATLYCSYYPNECINDKVLPYLDICDADPHQVTLNGKFVPTEFYDTLRELARYNEQVDAWIFDDDSNKLFDFANDPCCPDVLATYIAEYYLDDRTLIIWKR